MLSILPVAVVVAAGTHILLSALLRFTQGAKEPILIGDTIPLVTSIINMISKGGALHRLMREIHRYIYSLYAGKHGKLAGQRDGDVDSRDQYNLHVPIYTLRLPGSRMYVVNSPQRYPGTTMAMGPPRASFAVYGGRPRRAST